MINAFIIGVVVAWFAEWLFFTFVWKKKHCNAAVDSSSKNTNSITDELETSLQSLESEKGELSKRVVELEDQVSHHDKEQALSLAKLTESESHVAELENKLQADVDNSTAVETEHDDVADIVPLAVDNTKNDLSVIAGVGPKLREALNNEGIQSFNHLIAADIDELMATLKEKAVRFNKNNAATWQQQATLAAQGDWSGLDTLKAELKG